MESITPVMSAILRELSVICPIVLTTCDTTALPRAATSAAVVANSLACRADCALCCTVLVSTHRRSGFLQVGSRLLGALAQVVVARGDLGAGGGDAARGLLHLSHQIAQRLLHAAHGSHQAAHLVLLRGMHLVRQIAAGDALGQIARLGQRLRDGAHAEERERNEHRQPQQEPAARSRRT